MKRPLFFPEDDRKTVKIAVAQHAQVKAYADEWRIDYGEAADRLVDLGFRTWESRRRFQEKQAAKTPKKAVRK